MKRFNKSKRSVKKGGKRRFAKKRSAKKGRSGKSKQNRDTFHTRVTSHMTISPVQGVTVTNYIYGAVSILNTDSGVMNVTQNSEFATWRQMYDKFRCTKVTAVFTPRFKTADAFVAIAQIDAGNITAGAGTLYSAVDRDSGIPADISKILKMSSHQKHSIYKKAARTYSVQYPPNIWLDAQNIPSSASALLDSIGLRGCIGMYGQEFPEPAGDLGNGVWYDLTVHWECTFQGKVINSAINNVTGEVTLRQPTIHDYPAYSTITPVGNWDPAHPLNIEDGVDV